MYATTRQFLDYFNLKSLDQLPPLAEIKELDNLSGELGLDTPEPGGDAPENPTDERDEEHVADSVDDEDPASVAEPKDDDPTEQRADDGEESNTVG